MRLCLIALLMLPAFVIAQVEVSATRSVRMVIPVEKDRGLDIVARLVQPSFSKQFGQRISIDNRPGKDGFTGVEFAAKALPGEHVLLVAASHTLVVNPIHRRQRFNVLEEFTPIALLGKVRGALLVQSTLPVNELSELISYAKANPGRIRYGLSEGINPSNLRMLAVVRSNALHMECLEYRGSPEVADALVRGEIDVMYAAGASLARAAKSGRVKELDDARAEASLWIGVLVPRNTSAIAVDQAHRAVANALRDDTVTNKFRSMYLEPEVNPTPEAFTAFLEKERQHWTKIVNDAGLKD